MVIADLYTTSSKLKTILLSFYFYLKSQAWFQTKIAGHEVQLPLYYIHFEISKLGECQYLIDPVGG